MYLSDSSVPHVLESLCGWLEQDLSGYAEALRVLENVDKESDGEHLDAIRAVQGVVAKMRRVYTDYARGGYRDAEGADSATGDDYRGQQVDGQ